MNRWLVMQIGCLECGNPSDVLGTYPTLEEAQSRHPHARQRSLMDDGYAGDWMDSSIDVIYDLEEQ